MSIAISMEIFYIYIKEGFMVLTKDSIFTTLGPTSQVRYFSNYIE